MIDSEEGKKNATPSWLRHYITFIWGEDAFVSPQGPKWVDASGRARGGEA